MCLPKAPKDPGPSAEQLQAEKAAAQAEAAEAQRAAEMRVQENARRRARQSGGSKSLISGSRAGFMGGGSTGSSLGG